MELRLVGNREWLVVPGEGHTTGSIKTEGMMMGG